VTCRLPCHVKRQLCDILDPPNSRGNDWRMLAQRLSVDRCAVYTFNIHIGFRKKYHLSVLFMHWHQRTSNIGGLPFPFSPLSFSPFPSLNSPHQPPNQTHFGAFRGKNEAFQPSGNIISCIFNRQNLKVLLDLLYDSTNHEINYVDENSASCA